MSKSTSSLPLRSCMCHVIMDLAGLGIFHTTLWWCWIISKNHSCAYCHVFLLYIFFQELISTWPFFYSLVSFALIVIVPISCVGLLCAPNDIFCLKSGFSLRTLILDFECTLLELRFFGGLLCDKLDPWSPLVPPMIPLCW